MDVVMIVILIERLFIDESHCHMDEVNIVELLCDRNFTPTILQ